MILRPDEDGIIVIGVVVETPAVAAAAAFAITAAADEFPPKYEDNSRLTPRIELPTAVVISVSSSASSNKAAIS